MLRWEKEFEVMDTKVPNEVEIRVRNVHLRFRTDGKHMGLVAKFDPYREIYDPEALWVRKDLFKKICRQAAQIFKDKQGRTKTRTARKNALPALQPQTQL